MAAGIGHERFILRITMEGQGNGPLLLQTLEADVLHTLVGGAAIQSDRQRLPDQLLLGIAETGLGEAHALRQLAEEPNIRLRLAERIDGVIRELNKIVSIGALNV